MPSPTLYYTYDNQVGTIASPDSTLDAFLSSSPLSLFGVLDVKETTKDQAKLQVGRGGVMEKKVSELEGRSFRVTHVSGDDELKVFVK